MVGNSADKLRMPKSAAYSAAESQHNRWDAELALSCKQNDLRASCYRSADMFKMDYNWD